MLLRDWGKEIVGKLVKGKSYCHCVLSAVTPATGKPHKPSIWKTLLKGRIVLLFIEKVFKKLVATNVIHCNLCSFAVLVGGPLPRGHEFELHDVRFHWGRENQRGSEHTVNFKAFPMEVREFSPCTALASEH